MLAAIKEMINPDVEICRDIENKQLMLKEESPDSKIAKLYITNIPENAFAFTLDHQPGGRANGCFKQLSSYLDVRNDKGINKACDLILLWRDGNAHTALVFDLKSNKPKVEATQKQLDNSELYLKYLLSMIAAHYGIHTDDVTIKKAIVTTDNRAIRKSATYRPNSEPSQICNYHIEAVQPKKNRVGYIALKKLSR